MWDETSQHGGSISSESLSLLNINSVHVERGMEAEVKTPDPGGLRFTDREYHDQHEYDLPGISSAQLRSGTEVFTKDELVVPLNQRLQQEGRWDINESLLDYPGSDRD